MPFFVSHFNTMEAPVRKSFRYAFGKASYDLSARTHIMGIVNVTPDSFSDGGAFLDPPKAVEHGLRLIDEGADFIDVGGESTRPGSESVSLDEELRRVLPVIEKLSARTDIPISIDTYKHEVAARALDAGATIVNDISGLHFDPLLAAETAKRSGSIILMHIKGAPRTMQVSPVYEDVIGEISAYLQEGIQSARTAGIRQIIIDPGIGFGKTLEHNLSIFHHLSEFQRLGCPVLVGPSRKSFLKSLLDLPVDQRLEGTAAAVAASIRNGAQIVRVHDVRPMKRVAAVVDAIMRAG